MQEVTHLAAQEKPLVTTGHYWPFEGLPVLLHNDFEQFQTSFEIGISSDLIIQSLTLKHETIKNFIIYMQPHANYTHPSLHLVKLLTLTSAADVRRNLVPMGNHLLNHKKSSTQL